MGAKIFWHQWDDQGIRTGILMYPEEITEQQALAEVGMGDHRLQKFTERRFAADCVRVCAYRLEPSLSSRDPLERSLEPSQIPLEG